MESTEKFQQRIKYGGDIKALLLKIASDYDIGSYVSHEIAPFGYEDFNVTLTTDKGHFFIKMFASVRSPEECKRIVESIEKAMEAEVSVPKLYKSSQGNLHEISMAGANVRLCIMEHRGKSLFELGIKPTQEEKRFLVEQAALINGIDFKPKFVYDSWAVTNFLERYKQTKKHLDTEDIALIDPVAEAFSKLKLSSFPHAFVHGDIITSNVLKDRSGELFIIDFSVANYYPRIQELAVLLCNILFDEYNPAKFLKDYEFALKEYQKRIGLTSKEIETLPLYLRAAHAMHVLGATSEKIKGNNSDENEYWLRLGKIGLLCTKNFTA